MDGLKQDVSEGIDPILMSFDIRTDMIYCRADGKIYSFDSRKLPFTTKEIDGYQYADKALVLKHG